MRDLDAQIMQLAGVRAGHLEHSRRRGVGRDPQLAHDVDQPGCFLSGRAREPLKRKDAPTKSSPLTNALPRVSAEAKHSNAADDRSASGDLHHTRRAQYLVTYAPVARSRSAPGRPEVTPKSVGDVVDATA